MSSDYFVALDNEIGGLQPETSTVRYHRLIAEGKKKGRDGADELRSKWAKQHIRVDLDVPEGAFWNWIAQPIFDLSILPRYSFSLHFTFTLNKPFLSKDDNPFYIIDNPIVRDKVFRLPMVRPSSWKGNLYAALWQLGYRKDQDKRVQRLFGVIRSDEAGQSGRLSFFPTFFTQVGLEIINPHDRKRRVGKNPILFESVPIGASGIFTLLYVPFDRIGLDKSETCAQLAEDLPLLARGLQAMFRTYGFSAKRTSGYGTTKDEITGLLKTRADEKQVTSLTRLAHEVADVQF